jgi:hypothetical protein
LCNLQVGRHTIIEAKQHSRLCGHGCPPLLKPVTHRMRLTQEKLNQFDSFFSDKNNVNILLYKTDNKSKFLFYICKTIKNPYGKSLLNYTLMVWDVQPL